MPRDRGMPQRSMRSVQSPPGGFGGLLLELLTSDSVRSLLSDVIHNAFAFLILGGTATGAEAD